MDAYRHRSRPLAYHCSGVIGQAHETILQPSPRVLVAWSTILFGYHDHLRLPAPLFGSGSSRAGEHLQLSPRASL